MSVVAISETLGSLGDEIGHGLGRALGWSFADREIIAKAAEQFGESVVELAHITEEKPTLWERVADTKRHYVASVEAVLCEMAAQDNVVLSGRGSTILLARVPHVLRVLVTAPAPVRARRVEQRQGLTHEAAVDLVRDTDHERAARIRFLYHVDWGDPLLYDLVLNTERVSVERAVTLIRDMLGEARFQSTPESRRQVTDLALAARARALLAADPAIRPHRLAVACQDGHLVLSGSVDEERHKRAAEALLRGIPGAAGVRTEVVVLRAGRPPAGAI